MICKWKTDESIKCSGKVLKRDLFEGFVAPPGVESLAFEMFEESVNDMPICDAHYKIHKEIMKANRKGIPIEENLELTTVKRRKRIIVASK
jgi:hypothetical protein